MALSPNYGWTEPDNTGLVKNGAQDMRTLGDAIDTSVWNIGYGQAGKNKIINGDFAIAQRGTSITMAQNGYNLDRWTASVGTAFPVGTVTRQVMPVGNTITGYEFNYFMRVNPTSANGCTTYAQTQKIEDVRTFAGQTATLSFWMKADAACTPTVQITQNFGTGGSSNVSVLSPANISATTAWTRFTFTVSVPSISGKTVGTGSALDVSFLMPLVSGVVRVGSYDITGVQLEYGSKATPFQTASGGSPQAEEAMCQRYYFRTTQNANVSLSAYGNATSTTVATISMPYPVSMRVTPTAIDFSSVYISDGVNAFTGIASVTLGGSSNNIGEPIVTINSGTLTQFRTYKIQALTNGGFIGFSAELQEMTMDNVTFQIVNEIEHAIIDHGDGSFTSMLKSTYDEMKANEATAE